MQATSGPANQDIFGQLFPNPERMSATLNEQLRMPPRAQSVRRAQPVGGAQELMALNLTEQSDRARFWATLNQEYGCRADLKGSGCRVVIIGENVHSETEIPLHELVNKVRTYCEQNGGLRAHPKFYNKVINKLNKFYIHEPILGGELAFLWLDCVRILRTLQDIWNWLFHNNPRGWVEQQKREIDKLDFQRLVRA